MPGIKELKTRIKSISGTRKVTRAMQMVSAAKMRKSQDATMRSRGYASLAWELILSLSGVISAQSRIDIEEPDPWKDADAKQQVAKLLHFFPNARKIAVLILTTNRGMVGSLNTNLLAMAQKVISTHVGAGLGRPSSESGRASAAPTETTVDADIITFGRKGRDVMVRSHREVLADFEKFDRAITPEDIFPISELITNLYTSGKYQKIYIVYNHFVSTLAQKPTVKRLLPFTSMAEADEGAWPEENGEPPANPADKANETYTLDYLFEPDPKEVLGHLLPRIIESQIYQTILESEASEQSARMVMMKNATEAAGDLISDLTLTYNKLRQNKITTELAEITAGKIALE